jgi:hypothetical protein
MKTHNGAPRAHAATGRQEINMNSTDAFALKNSDLNTFLFADVGTEQNGSALTVLSVLARLGEDPWAEAARWTNMSKSAAVDCLAQSIGKMPLDPLALADTYATASRLILLLPLQSRHVKKGVRGTSHLPTALEWVPMALFCLSLVFAFMFNMVSAPVSPAGATAPTAEIVRHAAAVKSN